MSAHYNGYFYASEEIKEIEAYISKNIEEKHDQMLDLYPQIDSALASHYQDHVKEAIKMASLSIQRHPNSKWVNNNYIMVGLAHLYSTDFKSAIQTFKYVNTKSSTPDIQHAALVLLIYGLIQNGEYDNAEKTIQFIEKKELSKKNKKNLYLAKAYFYQKKRHYELTADNLSKVSPWLTKKDDRGKIYFITGQVYATLGKEKDANRYYKKCIATHPPYKTDIYAQLGNLQTTPLVRDADKKKIYKKFSKMIDDAKNINFKDKIYYELATFEKKQEHEHEAIKNYTVATHAGSNEIIKGLSFYELGKIYLHSLEKFVLAKKYYDSTLFFLPKDIHSYKTIKKTQEILTALTEQIQTIQWKDSLLYMASLDSANLQNQLKKTIEGKRKEEKRKEEKENKSVSTDIVGNKDLSTTLTSNWYFDNAASVSIGQNEFRRIWGDIPLEDNWRCSSKVFIKIQNENIPLFEKPAATIKQNEPSTLEEETEIADIFSQLPTTADEQIKINKEIEHAYFTMGEIFWVDLTHQPKAVETYETVLTRFPKSKRIPEALYKLHQISQESNTPQQSNKYAQQLLSLYPDSDYAKILLNPAYLSELQRIEKNQKKIYKKAYDYFKKGHLKEATQYITAAFQLGNSNFIPYLKMIKILIIGQTERLEKYQQALISFLLAYKEHALHAYAQKLLDASKTNLQQDVTIRYENSKDDSHYFMVVYPQKDYTMKQINSSLSKTLQINQQYAKLKTHHRVLNATYEMLIVSDFPNALFSLDFFDAFNDNPFSKEIRVKDNIYIFTISHSNSDILHSTEALHEYIAFFNQYYKR